MNTASGTLKRIRLVGPSVECRINRLVREAAQLLINATSLAKDIPVNHPLCRALSALAEVDRMTAHSVNEIHWPDLFEPCRLGTPASDLNSLA